MACGRWRSVERGKTVSADEPAARKNVAGAYSVGAAVGSGDSVAADAASAHAVLPTLLDKLRDCAVRDLAWLLLSADLLRPQPPVGELASPFASLRQLDDTVDWLCALDAAPAPLHDDLAATRMTRLGRYAERLLGWFLQHGPTARLIAAGVPLRRAGVTLGECDFLLHTQEGARLHWELAVKCYLHAGNVDARTAPLSPSASSLTSSLTSSQLSNYVGPNLKDRFDLKLAHLLSHQLPLSAREDFASTGYPGPWTPQMFVKGWLFYRHGETPADAVELDPAHGRGWWVTRSEWPDFAAAHAQHWRVLPRLEWLAPRRYGQDAEQAASRALVDPLTLTARSTQQTGPTMIAALAEDAAGNLVERSRGFVVPDEWPEQAQAYARQ
ncbi:DUF1853 family protein [Paraburkholderia caledonica]|uniref:DUF1853 family protein n=1 Tax=Paraburkholderia caledonica TaxID=134536 RepID=UPI00286AEF13|nr:DUF1853 family protein [Paraburkholderia caledonica]